MKKIFIRLGHDILANGYCTGSDGIVEEYKIVREYGKSLAQALEEHFEVKVFDSTPGTFTTSSEALTAGVTEANNWGADLFISCHANKYNGKAKGTEVFYYKGDKTGLILAQHLSKIIANTLGTHNRGAKNGSSLYEIKRTNMTAILLETFFIDSAYDVAKYQVVTGEVLGKKIAKTLIKNIKKNGGIYYAD